MIEPPDSPAAMWDAFLSSRPDPPKADSYTAWHFCDTQEPADALAELVVAGRKRAATLDKVAPRPARAGA